MRVLITGITGFAGSHLADHILDNHPDAEVYGIVRWRSRMENVLHIQDKIRLFEADLKDIVSLKKSFKISASLLRKATTDTKKCELMDISPPVNLIVRLPTLPQDQKYYLFVLP